MSVDPRTPCIIGVANHTWRGAGAPEPLAMWDEVVRAAADDAAARGGADAVLGRLGSLQVVFTQSWNYDDPAGRLAERLGIDPAHRHYTGIGGTTPQQLVGDTARRMLAGELDVAAICGAEALATVRAIKKAGERPAWSHRDPERTPFPLEAPFLDTEISHEVFQAWLTFACWDNARRAARGTDLDTYRAELGELLAPMSRVAAGNPDAWFPTERSATEIVTADADNRMVGYPYTKYMVAVMDVDMAAALIVATHGAADALGVPPESRVYLRGFCYATDPWYLAEHDAFDHSPGLAAAAAETLRVAGVGIDDVAHLDLYSCFASSVNFALDALGIAPTDDRPVTVTGGLPYHGGPGSNYLSHSLAAMVRVLRDDPGSLGLLSGVGMHMTKHVYGLYGTEPPTSGALGLPDEAGVQAGLDARRRRTVVPTATGPATVATYSVVHGRHGGPAWALAVCDLPGGDRCYAKLLDADLLADAERHEWVGAAVTLVDGGHGVNLVTR